jgi:hypothetical protein
VVFLCSAILAVSCGRCRFGQVWQGTVVSRMWDRLSFAVRYPGTSRLAAERADTPRCSHDTTVYGFTLCDCSTTIFVPS